MTRLVLVGGGHAHLSVLRALAQKRPSGIDVVLITPAEHQNYSGMLPGWVAGHYTQAECRVDLRPLVHAAGASLILDQIVGMDAARRCVGLGDGRHLEYDLLSLDVGSETDTSWRETLGSKLLPVKPLDNFFALWPKILAQARATSDYRLVVVGAGAAGVEIALAAQHAFSNAAVDGRVDLVASDSGMLPGHAKKVQARLHRFAERAGLGLHFLRGVGTHDGVMLADGQRQKAHLVIAATGARNLLSCGPRYAVASWGRWSAEGEWVWRWKDWIDRRFIRRFSEATVQQDAPMVEETK